MAKDKSQEVEHFSTLDRKNWERGQKLAKLLDQFQPLSGSMSWIIYLNNLHLLPIPFGGWDQAMKKVGEMSNEPEKSEPEICLPQLPPKEIPRRVRLQDILTDNRLTGIIWYAVFERDIWNQHLPGFADFSDGQLKQIQRLAEQKDLGSDDAEQERILAKAVREPNNAEERQRIQEAAEAFRKLVKSQIKT